MSGMAQRFRFDADDPFGTRPDEKPPAGWDDRFWDGVRDRIRRGTQEPGASRLPDPPRRNGAVARTVALLVVTTAAGAAAVVMASRPAPPVVPVERLADATTLVRVSGSADPAVAVEWARSEGRASGYVVFESLTPEISYVLIDSRLADPAPPGPDAVRTP